MRTGKFGCRVRRTLGIDTYVGVGRVDGDTQIGAPLRFVAGDVNGGVLETVVPRVVRPDLRS